MSIASPPSSIAFYPQVELQNTYDLKRKYIHAMMYRKVVFGMTEAEKRQHRVCFTGHRPEKLTVPECIVKRELEKEIRLAIADDMAVFISGMARGVDLWAAEIVLKIRAEGQGIKLICACPFNGFENSWGAAVKEQYRSILEGADLVRYICPKYTRSCFQIRNEWMVDHAARVIAVFNGTSSGTKNTVDYAKRVGIPVRIIHG